MKLYYENEENGADKYSHFLKQRTTDEAIDKHKRQAKARKTTKKGNRDEYGTIEKARVWERSGARGTGDMPFLSEESD